MSAEATRASVIDGQWGSAASRRPRDVTSAPYLGASGITDPDQLRSVPLPWPLTGRGEEMHVIEAALSTSAASSGVVVCGAAGVGKSRIVREALTRAAATGRCEVRWAVATSSAREVPLGAFASWAGSSVADTLQLVRGVVDSLTSAAPGTQVILGVDDAHLLDRLSTFVLHQIVQRGAAKVAMTIRADDPIPAGLGEVWKAGRFERLDLQPLSQDETAGLLSATLDGWVDPHDAYRLWTLTHGNALYLRNIVEQDIIDGRLACRNGCWRWTGGPVVPSSLVQLIESRIGALPGRVDDVMDVLAVGEPIELGSLRRIVDSASVEEADVRGLITLEAVDSRVDVRLAHPLYGEVRRNRTAATRLRRLRGMVATELAASDTCDEMQIVVRRASLALDSDLEPDADLLVRAAQGAVWLTDLPLADRLADAAVRAGGAPEANFLRAYVLSSLGRGREAEAVLVEIPAGELSDAERARLAFFRAINRFFTLADPTGAKALVDDAADTTPTRARAPINAFLTVYWAAMGKPEEALRAAATVSRDTLPDIVARFWAWAMTVALGHAGRAAEAAAAAAAGYPVPVRGFVIITDANVGAFLLSGHVLKAQEQAEFLIRRTATIPGRGELQSAPVAARAALGGGRLETACELLEPIAEALSASGETNGWRYRCQMSLTIALAIRGLADQAADAFAALEAARHPGWKYLDYEHAIARAWVSVCQGAVSEAVEIVLSAAESARANGQFAPEVMCLQTAAQFGDASRADRLRELAVIVEGPRAGLAARFAEALRAGDGAALAGVSQDFECMGDLVAALDAAAYAAIAYRRKDLRGSALGCSTRAEALAQQCDASTPALRQASQRLPLSDREREIVMLLGQGLSTRAVADRLRLSVRTIEGHVYRAMSRTGAASRDELAALLHPAYK